MGLGLVARIPSLVEAQIACGALRSAGIDAQVFDGNFGAMESPVIESLGGFRLMAPQEQLSDARETLRALRAAPGLPTGDETPWESATTASSAGRRRLRGLALFLLSLPTLIWLILRFLR